MDSSSSSGDGTEFFEAVAERVGVEDVEINAAEAVFEEETIATKAASAEETTAPDVSFGEEVTVAEASTNEDVVSMDELEAAKALLMMSPLHLPVIQNPLRELLMSM